MFAFRNAPPKGGTPNGTRLALDHRDELACKASASIADRLHTLDIGPLISDFGFQRLAFGLSTVSEASSPKSDGSRTTRVLLRAYDGTKGFVQVGVPKFSVLLSYDTRR